jgi:hypothetical protein
MDFLLGRLGLDSASSPQLRVVAAGASGETKSDKPSEQPDRMPDMNYGPIALIVGMMALIESPQVCLPKIPTCERLSA